MYLQSIVINNEKIIGKIYLSVILRTAREKITHVRRELRWNISAITCQIFLSTCLQLPSSCQFIIWQDDMISLQVVAEI